MFRLRSLTRLGNIAGGGAICHWRTTPVTTACAVWGPATLPREVVGGGCPWRSHDWAHGMQRAPAGEVFPMLERLMEGVVAARGSEEDTSLITLMVAIIAVAAMAETRTRQGAADTGK